MNNNMLSIGSVVMLQGGRHKVMVVGYYPVSDENSLDVYDYLGCLYPEGIFSFEHNIMFNHSSIKEIFAQGYSDNTDNVYKNKLNDMKNKYIKDGKLIASPSEIFESLSKKGD